ncbi:MAG: class I SAM-dependent RNA methyltransferase [Phyllobacteriaceae bacterium]|jgi:23S rRNA (uracil1939-C5)-methyltransferase|nr:class I SAM-dependent RNA methyltransferase [Phyllobacteriaceae bacterium]
MVETMTISAMGALGDGLADHRGETIYVPGALPGETVRATIGDGRANDVEIVTPSSERVSPPCPHFSECGGCAVQHWADAPYRAWKRQLVVDALRRQGIEACVAELVPGVPATRRRATFSVLRRPDGVRLGFQQAGSHAIVESVECRVVDPILVKARGALKALAKAVLPIMKVAAKPASMTVTVTRTGLDVALAGDFALTEPARQAAIGIALRANLARLTVRDEVLAETRKPTVSFGGIAVALPSGGFIQATAKAESAMRDLVAGHMQGAKSVADLFSGCGTFALPLARFARVHAVEGDRASLAALDAGWRAATGEKLRRVTTERRDLFMRPVTSKELDAFDGLVFDPPRAGAEAQAHQIAASRVGKIAAVSCNPVTLARDLAILTAAGYRIVSVTPIDQFLWSPHVEVVALLER